MMGRLRRRAQRHGLPKRAKSRIKRRRKLRIGLGRRQLGALGSREYEIRDGAVRRVEK